MSARRSGPLLSGVRLAFANRREANPIACVKGEREWETDDPPELRGSLAKALSSRSCKKREADVIGIQSNSLPNLDTAVR